LLYLKVNNQLTLLNKPHITLTTGADNPCPGGLENGVRKRIARDSNSQNVELHLQETFLQKSLLYNDKTSFFNLCCLLLFPHLYYYV